MKADIICFTARGLIMANRIRRAAGSETGVYYKFKGENAEGCGCGKYVTEPLTEWATERFKTETPLVFIGACGIAVRSIAPSVHDKFKDIPVVVMDEAGRHVIPILSAHYGGAGELAAEIAEITHAEMVITTATDVNELFAIDLFARKNNLTISSKEGVKKVSGRILSGDTLTFRVEGGKTGSGFPDELKMVKKGDSDIFISPYRDKREGNYIVKLVPKVVYAGIGCVRGKAKEDIEELFDKTFEGLGLEKSSIKGIATLDFKADENGLREFARERDYSFQTFSSEILKKIKGNFTASAFVAKTVGIDNVCERACMAAAGNGAVLICRKKAWNGVTVAFAMSKWSVVF